MAESTRDTHPNNSPYCVVAVDDHGNPPHMSWFKSKKLAVTGAQESAFKYGRVFHVFEVKRIAAVHPQPAKVYED